MTGIDHEAWMRESNPEGWDSQTWAAFAARVSIDHTFRALSRERVRQRLEWVQGEMRRTIGRRNVTAAFREQSRRELDIASYKHFPRPDPLLDGWRPPTGMKISSAIENIWSE